MASQSLDDKVEDLKTESLSVIPLNSSLSDKESFPSLSAASTPAFVPSDDDKDRILFDVFVHDNDFEPDMDSDDERSNDSSSLFDITEEEARIAVQSFQDMKEDGGDLLGITDQLISGKILKKQAKRIIRRLFCRSRYDNQDILDFDSFPQWNLFLSPNGKWLAIIKDRSIVIRSFENDFNENINDIEFDLPPSLNMLTTLITWSVRSDLLALWCRPISNTSKRKKRQKENKEQLSELLRTIFVFDLSGRCVHVLFLPSSPPSSSSSLNKDTEERERSDGSIGRSSPELVSVIFREVPCPRTSDSVCPELIMLSSTGLLFFSHTPNSLGVTAHHSMSSTSSHSSLLPSALGSFPALSLLSDMSSEDEDEEEERKTGLRKRRRKSITQISPSSSNNTTELKNDVSSSPSLLRHKRKHRKSHLSPSTSPSRSPSRSRVTRTGGSGEEGGAASNFDIVDDMLLCVSTLSRHPSAGWTYSLTRGWIKCPFGAMALSPSSSSSAIEGTSLLAVISSCPPASFTAIDDDDIPTANSLGMGLSLWTIHDSPPFLTSSSFMGCFPPPLSPPPSSSFAPSSSLLIFVQSILPLPPWRWSWKWPPWASRSDERGPHMKAYFSPASASTSAGSHLLVLNSDTGAMATFSIPEGRVVFSNRSSNLPHSSVSLASECHVRPESDNESDLKESESSDETTTLNVTSPTLCDVGWWSDRVIIRAFSNGQLVLSPLPTASLSLDESSTSLRLQTGDLAATPPPPESSRAAFNGSICITPAIPPESRCFVLQCQHGYKRRRKLWVAQQAAGKTTNAATLGSESSSEEDFFSTILLRRTYRLLSLARVTPSEFFHRAVNAMDYSEALAIAREYELDTAPVYQAQWLRSIISSASISSFLVPIQEKALDWVLLECSRRLCDSPSAMRALFNYGLSLTTLPLPPSTSSPYPFFENNITNTSKALFRMTFLRYLDRLSTFSRVICNSETDSTSASISSSPSLDDTETPSLFDPTAYSEFRDCSLYDLAILCAKERGNVDFLKTLVTYHSVEFSPEQWLEILRSFPETVSPVSYKELLPHPDATLLTDIEPKIWKEVDGDDMIDVTENLSVIQALKRAVSVLRRDQNLWNQQQRQLAASSSIEEATNTNSNSHDVELKKEKEDDGDISSQAGHRMNWEVAYVEVCHGEDVLLRKMCQRQHMLPTTSSLVSCGCSREQLLEWYLTRIVEIDDKSGQLDKAMQLCQIARGRGFGEGEEQLDALWRDMTELSQLVYTHSMEHLSLSSFRALDSFQRLCLVLEDSTADTIVDDLYTRGVIYLFPDDSRPNKDEDKDLATTTSTTSSSDLLIRRYLVHLAKEGRLDMILAVLQYETTSAEQQSDNREEDDNVMEMTAASKNMRRLIENGDIGLLETVLDCVYSGYQPNADSLNLASQCFECLPSSILSPSLSNSTLQYQLLIEAANQLEQHLSTARILSTYGVWQSLTSLRSIHDKRDIQAVEELYQNLTRKVVKSNTRSRSGGQHKKNRSIGVLGVLGGQQQHALSDKQWMSFLSKLLSLQTSSFSFFPTSRVYEMFFRTLLLAGNFDLASSIAPPLDVTPSNSLSPPSLSPRLTPIPHANAISPTPPSSPSSARLDDEAGENVVHSVTSTGFVLLLSHTVIVQLLLNVAREFFNSASSVDHPSLARAEECLLSVLPICPDIESELNLIEGVRMLANTGMQIIPLDIRLSSDRLEFIEHILDNSNLLQPSSPSSSTPTTPTSVSHKSRGGGGGSVGENHTSIPPIYSDINTLLHIGELLGLRSQYQQSRVYMSVARAAQKAGDLAFATNICLTLIQQDFRPAWKLCMELASSIFPTPPLHSTSSASTLSGGAASSAAVIDSRKILCGQALWSCPLSEIEDVLQLWKELQTQELCLKVNISSDLPPSDCCLYLKQKIQSAPVLLPPKLGIDMSMLDDINYLKSEAMKELPHTPSLEWLDFEEARPLVLSSWIENQEMELIRNCFHNIKDMTTNTSQKLELEQEPEYENISDYQNEQQTQDIERGHDDIEGKAMSRCFLNETFLSCSSLWHPELEKLGIPSNSNFSSEPIKHGDDATSSAADLDKVLLELAASTGPSDIALMTSYLFAMANPAYANDLFESVIGEGGASNDIDQNQEQQHQSELKVPHHSFPSVSSSHPSLSQQEKFLWVRIAFRFFATVLIEKTQHLSTVQRQGGSEEVGGDIVTLEQLQQSLASSFPSYFPPPLPTTSSPPHSKKSLKHHPCLPFAQHWYQLVRHSQHSEFLLKVLPEVDLSRLEQDRTYRSDIIWQLASSTDALQWATAWKLASRWNLDNQRLLFHHLSTLFADIPDIFLLQQRLELLRPDWSRFAHELGETALIEQCFLSCSSMRPDYYNRLALLFAVRADCQRLSGTSPVSSLAHKRHLELLQTTPLQLDYGRLMGIGKQATKDDVVISMPSSRKQITSSTVSSPPLSFLYLPSSSNTAEVGEMQTSSLNERCEILLKEVRHWVNPSNVKLLSHATAEICSSSEFISINSPPSHSSPSSYDDSDIYESCRNGDIVWLILLKKSLSDLLLASMPSSDGSGEENRRLHELTLISEAVLEEENGPSSDEDPELTRIKILFAKTFSELHPVFAHLSRHSPLLSSNATSRWVSVIRQTVTAGTFTAPLYVRRLLLQHGFAVLRSIGVGKDEERKEREGLEHDDLFISMLHRLLMLFIGVLSPSSPSLLWLYDAFQKMPFKISWLRKIVLTFIADVDHETFYHQQSQLAAGAGNSETGGTRLPLVVALCDVVQQCLRDHPILVDTREESGEELREEESKESCQNMPDETELWIPAALMHDSLTALLSFLDCTLTASGDDINKEREKSMPSQLLPLLLDWTLFMHLPPPDLPSCCMLDLPPTLDAVIFALHSILHLLCVSCDTISEARGDDKTLTPTTDMGFVTSLLETCFVFVESPLTNTFARILVLTLFRLIDGSAPLSLAGPQTLLLRAAFNSFSSSSGSSSNRDSVTVHTSLLLLLSQFVLFPPPTFPLPSSDSSPYTSDHFDPTTLIESDLLPCSARMQFFERLLLVASEATQFRTISLLLQVWSYCLPSENSEFRSANVGGGSGGKGKDTGGRRRNSSRKGEKKKARADSSTSLTSAQEDFSSLASLFWTKLIDALIAFQSPQLLLEILPFALPFLKKRYQHQLYSQTKTYWDEENKEEEGDDNEDNKTMEREHGGFTAMDSFKIGLLITRSASALYNKSTAKRAQHLQQEIIQDIREMLFEQTAIMSTPIASTPLSASASTRATSSFISASDFLSSLFQQMAQPITALPLVSDGSINWDDEQLHELILRSELTTHFVDTALLPFLFHTTIQKYHEAKPKADLDLLLPFSTYSFLGSLEHTIAVLTVDGHYGLAVSLMQSASGLSPSLCSLSSGIRFLHQYLTSRAQVHEMIRMPAQILCFRVGKGFDISGMTPTGAVNRGMSVEWTYAQQLFRFAIEAIDDDYNQ